MPYIPQDDRFAIDDYLMEIPPLNSPGELTYALYKLSYRYLLDHEDNYETRNTVLGCLSATVHEFYRQQVAPYEDTKLAENGDVFDEYDTETPRDGADEGTPCSCEQAPCSGGPGIGPLGTDGGRGTE